MIRGEILSLWSDVSGNQLHPVTKFNKDGTEFTDATGQPDENIPPSPNLCVFAFQCDEATLTAMESDPEIEILWAETVVSDVG